MLLTRRKWHYEVLGETRIKGCFQKRIWYDRNPVTPGMWSGGVVGLKSILGVRRRSQALCIMHELESLGYIKFSHDLKTKKISYGLLVDYRIKTHAEHFLSWVETDQYVPYPSESQVILEQEEIYM